MGVYAVKLLLITWPMVIKALPHPVTQLNCTMIPNNVVPLLFQYLFVNHKIHINYNNMKLANIYACYYKISAILKIAE